jgi:hypothetical protein
MLAISVITTLCAAGVGFYLRFLFATLPRVEASLV